MFLFLFQKIKSSLIEAISVTILTITIQFIVINLIFSLKEQEKNKLFDTIKIIFKAYSLVILQIVHLNFCNTDLWIGEEIRKRTF